MDDQGPERCDQNISFCHTRMPPIETFGTAELLKVEVLRLDFTHPHRCQARSHCVPAADSSHGACSQHWFMAPLSLLATGGVCLKLMF